MFQSKMRFYASSDTQLKTANGWKRIDKLASFEEVAYISGYGDAGYSLCKLYPTEGKSFGVALNSPFIEPSSRMLDKDMQDLRLFLLCMYRGGEESLKLSDDGIFQITFSGEAVPAILDYIHHISSEDLLSYHSSTNKVSIKIKNLFVHSIITSGVIPKNWWNFNIFEFRDIISNFVGDFYLPSFISKELVTFTLLAIAKADNSHGARWWKEGNVNVCHRTKAIIAPCKGEYLVEFPHSSTEYFNPTVAMIELSTYLVCRVEYEKNGRKEEVVYLQNRIHDRD